MCKANEKCGGWVHKSTDGACWSKLHTNGFNFPTKTLNAQSVYSAGLIDKKCLADNKKPEDEKCETCGTTPGANIGWSGGEKLKTGIKTP